LVVSAQRSSSTTIPKCGFVMDKQDTNYNAWPWFVALEFWPSAQFFCSGSLISNKHVLSGE
jgi:hypothetical protein